MAKSSFHDLINSEKPVLIDFSAEWCGPCKMMGPVLKELKSMVGDDVNIIKIDVDRNRQLASNLKIQSVPTMIIFQNGNIKWRGSGVLPAAQIKRIIMQTTSKEIA